jgi:hypothetical protein
VNRGARLVIVGITPGPNQIKAAYKTAQRLLRAGASDDIVLAEAKREGSFGSTTMRPKLVQMLDELSFQHLLGLRSCASLWEESFNLLHATSVVPHAAFRGSKPFAGSFSDVLESDALRRGFEEHFVPSFASLSRTALYVALGPTPLAALDWCAERRHLDADQIMGALAHPSTNGGSQVDVYLGKKVLEDLTERDPVINRVRDLQAQARRMREAVERVRTGAPMPTLAPMPTTYPVPSSAAISGTPSPTRSTRTSPAAETAPAADYVDLGRRAVFERIGFRCVNDKVKKVALFAGRASEREVYLVNGRSGIIVVVHPNMLDRAKAAVREPASTVKPKLFHNDDMRTFPDRDNGGKRPVRYGRAVACQTLGALEDFLISFDAA